MTVINSKTINEIYIGLFIIEAILLLGCPYLSGIGPSFTTIANILIILGIVIWVFWIIFQFLLMWGTPHAMDTWLSTFLMIIFIVALTTSLYILSPPIISGYLGWLWLLLIVLPAGLWTVAVILNVKDISGAPIEIGFERETYIEFPGE